MPDTTLPTPEQVQSWPGLQVKDSAGTALGTVRSVYGDDDTGAPEWVEVDLADDGMAYVPVLGATATDQELRLAHAADRIVSAPRFAADAKLEVEDERALYAHYGIETSQELSDTLLPAAADLPDEAPATAPPTPVATTPPATTTTPPATRPTPAPVSGLKRVEQTPAAVPPAPAPLLPPVTPPPAVPERSGKGRQAALLAAVPAVLLVARRLRGRRQTPQDRVQRATPGGAALLLPVVAGGVAAVLQRRTRREQKHPVEAVPATTLTGPVVVGAASVPADRT